MHKAEDSPVRLDWRLSALRPYVELNIRPNSSTSSAHPKSYLESLRSRRKLFQHFSSRGLEHCEGSVFFRESNDTRLGSCKL